MSSKVKEPELRLTNQVMLKLDEDVLNTLKIIQKQRRMRYMTSLCRDIIMRYIAEYEPPAKTKDILMKEVKIE